MSGVPRLSVVMSVYNDAAQAAQAIDSIRQQTFRDWELIVVNDGSTDSTQQVLEQVAAADSRVRVIQQENTGLTRALIRGCSEARGEWIARQDADDWSAPERFADQLACIARHPQAVMCSCTTEYVTPEGVLLETVRRSTDPATATVKLLNDRHGPPAHGSVIFRRSTYEEVGGYRSCFYFGQDSDLWLRLAEIGPYVHCDAMGYRYTASVTNLSTLFGSWQHQFGELGQAARAARKAGGSEQPFLDQARELCEQLRASRNAPRLTRRLQSAAYYRMGVAMSRNGSDHARECFRSAIRLNPWHWRSWCRLGAATLGQVAQGVRGGNQSAKRTSSRSESTCHSLLE